MVLAGVSSLFPSRSICSCNICARAQICILNLCIRKPVYWWACTRALFANTNLRIHVQMHTLEVLHVCVCMYTNATIHVDGTAASARCRLPPTKGGERRSCGQVSMVGSLPTSGHAVALSFEVSRKNSGSAPGVCTGGTEEMVGDLIRDLTWEWSNLFAALPRTVGNRSWGGIGGGWDLVTHREPLYECSLACLRARTHAHPRARTHVCDTGVGTCLPCRSKRVRTYMHLNDRVAS